MDENSVFYKTFFANTRRVTKADLLQKYKEVKSDETPDELLIMLANACIIELILFPKQPNIGIDMSRVCIAGDEKRVNEFPWGWLSYEALCNSINSASNSIRNNVNAYGLEGFSHALVAWAYDILPSLLDHGYGQIRNVDHLPRILRWNYVYYPNKNVATQMYNNVFNNKEVILNLLV